MKNQNTAIEQAHHIRLERFPAGYLASLSHNETGAIRGMYGIGDSIPDALANLERKSATNIAATNVVLPDGTVYGIAYSLMR